MIQFVSNLSVEMCRNSPTNIFVFGDNLQGWGRAGQAVIRNCSNAWGVPTKRYPSMKEDSFFSDRQDEYDIVLKELSTLWQMHRDGRTIVLPINPIGSGLARVQFRSPLVWSLIERFYDSAHRSNI